METQIGEESNQAAGAGERRRIAWRAAEGADKKCETIRGRVDLLSYPSAVSSSSNSKLCASSSGNHVEFSERYVAYLMVEPTIG